MADHQPQSEGDASTETHKEMVRRHIDLSWNQADFGALDQVWSADAVVHLWDGRSLIGLPALQQHLHDAVLAWTDRECVVESLAAEGDLVANRWTFRAADPTGTRWVTEGMDFYRFHNGRIVEEWIALGNAVTE
ncbi:MAG: hypothetical protein QOF21_2893 [Actinomycetota bacterium]|jgi:ketosteroid isomerase-like protein